MPNEGFGRRMVEKEVTRQEDCSGSPFRGTSGQMTSLVLTGKTQTGWLRFHSWEELKCNVVGITAQRAEWASTRDCILGLMSLF